jgi:serine protease inhibitor
MYDYQYPVERRVMEDRLSFLEREYNKFDYMINPYHIQPGLLLDVDITSIKRKKATLDAMANVLNEFLHGVSKGFQDAAFASFSRRRSTVREDINQTFADAGSEETGAPAASAGSQAYLDVLNTGGTEESAAIEAPKRGRAARSVAEAKPKKARRGRKSGGDSMKEI